MRDNKANFSEIMKRAMFEVTGLCLMLNILVSESWLEHQNWLISWQDYFVGNGMMQLTQYSECAYHPNKAVLMLLILSAATVPYYLWVSYRIKTNINIKEKASLFSPKLKQLMALIFMGFIMSALINYVLYFSDFDGCESPKSGRGLLLWLALMKSDISRALFGGLAVWASLFFYSGGVYGIFFFFYKYLASSNKINQGGH